jgi:outer membrane receptor for ferric coprogen and ferric-rhodotorulic acid
MASYAVAELYNKGNREANLTQPSVFISSYLSYLKFHTSMVFMSVIYHFSNTWQGIIGWIYGKKKKGFETVLDEKFKNTFEQEFPGMNIDPSAFDG